MERRMAPACHNDAVLGSVTETKLSLTPRKAAYHVLKLSCPVLRRTAKHSLSSKYLLRPSAPLQQPPAWESIWTSDR